MGRSALPWSAAFLPHSAQSHPEDGKLTFFYYRTEVDCCKQSKYSDTGGEIFLGLQNEACKELLRKAWTLDGFHEWIDVAFREHMCVCQNLVGWLWRRNLFLTFSRAQLLNSGAMCLICQRSKTLYT